MKLGHYTHSLLEQASRYRPRFSIHQHTGLPLWGVSIDATRRRRGLGRRFITTMARGGLNTSRCCASSVKHFSASNVGRYPSLDAATTGNERRTVR